MKKSIATKWVAALRSGDYKQGDGSLRDSETNSFCCLGVLCNLHAESHPKIAKTQKDPGVYLGESEFLPEEVLAWAGMDSSDGSTVGNTEININGKSFSCLTEANDSGTSFKRIATWIEKNYEKL